MSRTIMITGASRGIGLEMTRQAAARGDKVIACCRDAMQATDLIAAAKQNADITVLGLDVCAETDMNNIAAGMTRAIDILVCNAGVLNSYGGMLDPKHDHVGIENVLMTNVAGVFFTARAFLPHVKKETPGKIAVISSIMGSNRQSHSNAPIYRASKAAATNLARSMAVELEPDGIAVGAYHPGWVRTDMGGKEASISPEQSALGLLARFDALSLATTGVFENYKGDEMPF